MSEPLELLRDRYLAAQLRGDRREAVRLLVEEGLQQGCAAPELHLGVIAAAQREIGRLWEQNEISVAQEHVATAVSQLALAHLLPHFPTQPRNGKRVLVACVQGEQHAMGPRLAIDFLESAGFDVLFLGADVPTDSLVHAVLETAPDAVAISATLSFHLPALQQAVRRLRDVRPSLPIIVGGLALTSPELARELGVDVSQGTARDLVELIRARTGTRS